MKEAREKGNNIADILSKAYAPIQVFFMESEFHAGYIFNVYDRSSNEFYSLRVSYGTLGDDSKLIRDMIPQIEAFHKKHHNKLARLLRGEE
jgi:hypothetical protein